MGNKHKHTHPYLDSNKRLGIPATATNLRAVNMGSQLKRN